MIPFWRYFFWPVAVINRLRIGLRNKLFDLGIWKSVEFEVPVIYVGSLAGEPTLAVSFLISDMLNTSLHVDRLPEVKAKATPDRKSPYLYIKSYQEILFSTSHKVLGLSEWIQHHEETPAFVMDKNFTKNEIRPQLKVLVTDYNFPFSQDAIWPVGRLQATQPEIRNADTVIVCNTPKHAALETMADALRSNLDLQTPIFFITNSKASLASFNSFDKIEFIKDRDNFARLIMNVLPNTNPDSE